MTILIADDDPLMILLLSLAFQRAGFATCVALDVVQATQIINRQRVDAVVLDMSMPGGTGADLIHRLRMFKRTVRVPVVVVSGTVEDDARQQLLEMGADAFFPKPPKVEELIASVHRLIGMNRPAPASGATTNHGA